jgi:folate-binding protein YgfZ
MNSAHLTNRAIVRIDGEIATEFLQNLVTCDVEVLAPGEATFGALLTPQGKILFDFFCLRTNEGFLFDIEADMRADFIKRMMFYRLRSPVEIAPVDDGLKVFALWDGENDGFTDPRLGAMGNRLIAKTLDTNMELADYLAHRIALGMPEGGADYAYDEAFPHDAMMDQFGNKGAGVAFEKGCYVGQEVVSRMQHRGTARRRIMQVRAKRPLPASDASILADGKPVGTLGSVQETNGLAMVRIDRVDDAVSRNAALSVEGMAIELSLPEWTTLKGVSNGSS